MSLPVRHIRQVDAPDPPAPKIDRRAKAEFDSHMVMVRHLVDEADQGTGEHFYRSMMQQCKILSQKYGYTLK